MDKTSSMPMSVLRYLMDKVKYSILEDYFNPILFFQNYRMDVSFWIRFWGQYWMMCIFECWQTEKIEPLLLVWSFTQCVDLTYISTQNDKSNYFGVRLGQSQPCLFFKCSLIFKRNVGFLPCMHFDKPIWQIQSKEEKNCQSLLPNWCHKSQSESHCK